MSTYETKVLAKRIFENRLTLTNAVDTVHYKFIWMNFSTILFQENNAHESHRIINESRESSYLLFGYKLRFNRRFT